jgi:hypothetical protein
VLALLKTFERTGDEHWLEAGDLGVALFAAACLDADARFPVLDDWG